MTTRSIVLAINTTTIPQVGMLLAKAGITLGPVTSQTEQLRTFTVTDGSPKRIARIELSERDLTILHAYADGMSHKQVGAMFGKTEAAAKGFSKPLFRKLGAQDRAEAVAIAYRMGALNSWEVAA